MSGLTLPPAEPPADDVADVLEHVRAIRAELEEAARTVHRVREATSTASADLPAGVAAYRLGLRYGIEMRVAEFRQQLWGEHYHEAVQRARALGLEP